MRARWSRRATRAGWSRRAGARRLVLDALVGAASGLAASWVMAQAQRRILSAGGSGTKRREEQAQGELEPATARAARGAARAAGVSIPQQRMGAAAEAVHSATGAGFGALFGVLLPRVPFPAVAAGALYGTLVWLVNDEGLVPALGLSRKPWKYPASTHARALASHLVYGAATDVGFRLLGAAVR